jgi:NAD(P)H-binding
MKGADAVISVLGARGPVIAEATRAVVAAAEQAGPDRILMLSSFAVARDRLKPVGKLVTRIAMGSQIKDKTAGEEVLRASGLDWTIVYATVLTNGPKTEPRVVPETEKVGMQRISRADVASFLLQAATGVSTAVATSSLPDDQDGQSGQIRKYAGSRSCRDAGHAEANAPQPADPGLTWARTALGPAGCFAHIFSELCNARIRGRSHSAPGPSASTRLEFGDELGSGYPGCESCFRSEARPPLGSVNGYAGRRFAPRGGKAAQRPTRPDGACRRARDGAGPALGWDANRQPGPDA